MHSRGLVEDLRFCRARWAFVMVATVALVGAARAAPPRGRGLEEEVREKARALAAQAYRPPDAALPEPLEKLSYDQYRDIRFRPDRALWREERLPFHVQLFHQGFLFRTPVTVHLVEGGKARELRFSPELFDYGPLVRGRGVEQSGGFAGFRVHAPLNRPDYYDELLVFLGASYFRALGQGSVYGLSARALALDTALPSGEEFPSFREFWLEQPSAKADRVVVHALLDSPSVAGAYRFVVSPGKRTVMDVQASLFFRRPVQRLGVAPLTSMYLFGENDRGPASDFRPEVHDSDGLFVWMRGGEQLWRPLSNPPELRVTGFATEGLRAFGLLQRDQAFGSYEDLEARYDRRPSVWVEPVGDWGAGTVQLVEIPTREEVHDNVTAYWVPAAPPVPGQELRLAYRLSWGQEPPFPRVGAQVTATRVAAGSTPGAHRFVLDFSPASQPGEGPVEPVISASVGRILHASAQRNEVTGGWRVAFELLLEKDAPVELRCFLKRGGDALGETWSYLWTP
jgi:periplasmic glucans biosynthesis protein